MSIVAYRLYCADCDEETVVREDKIDDSPWKVNTLAYNDGLCPRCAQTPRSADSLFFLDSDAYVCANIISIMYPMASSPSR